VFPPNLEVELGDFSNLVTYYQRGPFDEGFMLVASSIENLIISI